MQRFFDVVLSGFALVYFHLFTAFDLYFTNDGREKSFQQTRVGRGGKDLNLYKFATMLKDSPKMNNGTVTVKNDPRVLPVGRFLRKTKVNELPQLINIFKGDMSIIGPRPQTQRCFDAFHNSIQIDITSVRPGLSGIGSVVFRSEEDMIQANADAHGFYDSVIMPYKGKLESWYVRNNSVWNYFLLIVITLIVVLTGSTRLIFYCYTSLPRPPKELKPFIASDYYE